MAAEPVCAYVGLGANLGQARQTLSGAVRALRQVSGVIAVRVSPLYRSTPVDAQGPDFLNAVCAVDTVLSPAQLLVHLQRIEHDAGRERPYRNAPRTLDLDLLLHGRETVQTGTLTVPHPRMHLRAFVLRPLLDLAPDLIIPGAGPAAAALAAATDQALTCVAGEGWADGVEAGPPEDSGRLS
jgi:2-amino-4-hydroxy-6-hydroxymethyldihydropteridine diphosphokinase